MRASIEKTAELAAAAPAARLTEVIEIDVVQRENRQQSMTPGFRGQAFKIKGGRTQGGVTAPQTAIGQIACPEGLYVNIRRRGTFKEQSVSVLQRHTDPGFHGLSNAGIRRRGRCKQFQK